MLLSARVIHQYKTLHPLTHMFNAPDIRTDLTVLLDFKAEKGNFAKSSSKKLFEAPIV